MKINRLLFALTITATILSTGCAWKGSKDAVNIIEEQPVTVETAEVLQGEIESTISYSGKVKPVKEIMITPKQPGKVIKIGFDIGERVKAGDVLFQLDKNDVMLQLSQAATAVELAELNLSKMEGSTYEQQLMQLETAVILAEISYSDAQTNYDNVKTLYEAGAESKFNLDRTESQLNQLKQQYKAAKTNYELFEEKSYKENIELSKIQLEQSKAAYNVVHNSLESMDVRSPINGVISARNLRVGEFVSNATVTFVVIDDSSYILEIDVGENTIGKIEVGDKAKVYVDSISKEVIWGTVTVLAPSADMHKQTYPVRITINDPPDTLKGGMFAEVKLIIEKADNAVIVPLSSVLEEKGSKYIYVVKGDEAKKVQITIGLFNDKEIQILDGLNVNDLIIIKGQDYLKDGSKVLISH
jgi:HlyD family secretion protein